MKFGMKRPCANCPFRTDVPGYLSAERAEEIADCLLSDHTFACHATVDYSEDDEDGGNDGRVTADTQHCAGAMIVLERIELPNQMMRIMERLGGYDRRLLDMTAPVFADLDEFTAHHDS